MDSRRDDQASELAKAMAGFLTDEVRRQRADVVAAPADDADLRAAFGGFRAPRPAPTAAVPGSAPASGPAPAGDRGDLIAAREQVIEHEATRPTDPTRAEAPLWRRLALPTVALAATVAALYLTLARPDWLYPRFQQTPQLRSDAQAEQYAVAAAMLAEEFHEEYGRLPASSAELGLDFGALVFAPMEEGRYRVTVRGPSRTVVVEGGVGGGR